jgi:hypothetical protein
MLEIKDNYTKDLQATGKKLSNHKEVDKEVDKEKEKKLKISDPLDIETANRIRKKLISDNPKFSDGKNIAAWSNDIRLMREIDKYSHSEIWGLFEFANSDPFWGKNILSPFKLRKNKDMLIAQKNARNKNSVNPFDDPETRHNNELVQKQMREFGGSDK